MTSRRAFLTRTAALALAPLAARLAALVPAAKAAPVVERGVWTWDMPNTLIMSVHGQYGADSLVLDRITTRFASSLATTAQPAQRGEARS